MIGPMHVCRDMFNIFCAPIQRFIKISPFASAQNQNLPVALESSHLFLNRLLNPELNKPFIPDECFLGKAYEGTTSAD